MAKKSMEIETRNLNVYYDKHHVLKDINVRIPSRKLTAIIGPSGCGKTTLLKTFNRLLEIRDNVKISGEVIVNGENIFTSKKDVSDIRKNMGLLSQKPYPLPMSIYDNVAYGLKIHNHIKTDELQRRVKHCLEESGIWKEVRDRLHDSATGLSLGQQQRLCLARALAVEPEIFLCDEPTSALDPIAAQQIERLLDKLRNNFTIILVTHTLRQARRLADYVIFLYFGRAIEQGSANEIFNNPKNSETKAYVDGDIS